MNLLFLLMLNDSFDDTQNFRSKIKQNKPKFIDKQKISSDKSLDINKKRTYTENNDSIQLLNKQESFIDWIQSYVVFKKVCSIAIFLKKLTLIN